MSIAPPPPPFVPPPPLILPPAYFPPSLASPPLPLNYALPDSQPIAADSPPRARWLDAFRGFTMLCLISRGFGIPELKDTATFSLIAKWFEHSTWGGITPWDLIQPFFMFIVGAAMPFAFENRWKRGETWGQSLGHVVKRCLLLLLWSHIAIIGNSGKFEWALINVLSQIAFTYFIAFFVLRSSWVGQAIAIISVLGFHYGMHVYWGGFTQSAWDPETNVGAVLDRMVLNKNWNGDYATLNFLTSSSATIAGIMVANLLRGTATSSQKALILAVGGGALIGVGLAISPWVPFIKRIWTPSFALISIGITVWASYLFYFSSKVLPQFSRGLFTVVGANCIFLYLASQLFGGSVAQIMRALTSPLFKKDVLSASTYLFIVDWLVLGVFIFLAYWLHRRKIFFKL